MKLVVFNLLICLPLMFYPDGQTGESNKQHPFVGNSSSGRQINANASVTNSNINGNAEKFDSTSVTAQNNLNASAPAIFNISEAEIEAAFAEGENLFRNKSGSITPLFGKENKVEFRLQAQAKLVLAITFKIPRNEAQEQGFKFAKTGSNDRDAALNNTKKIIAQHSKQVNFQVIVKDWSGGENTPRVRFAMRDAEDNSIQPNKNPQLDFCGGKDILRPCEAASIVFPLFQGEKALLTDTMESLTLAINVDETGNETSFRLR